MKKNTIIAAAIGALAFCSCSVIDETERLIYVAPAEAARNILIEDFTGQECVNCPDAAQEIHELQTVYGSDKVIAVGIYSGPFGAPGRPSYGESLVTEEGKAYWDKNFDNNQSQPVGLISRGTPTTSWTAEAAKAMQVTTNVTIDATTFYSEATRELKINTSVTGPVNEESNLQVWLTEDNIIGYQAYKDKETGKTMRTKEYVHNHVFRSSVNGTWGEAIKFSESALAKEYSFTLPEEWNAENVNVVIFTYDDKEGVHQVIQVPVIK